LRIRIVFLPFPQHLDRLQKSSLKNRPATPAICQLWNFYPITRQNPLSFKKKSIVAAMKSISILVLMCLLTSASQAQTDAKEPLTDAFAYIDAWLEAQQVYEKIPGISVGIVKDQDLIWSRGYGLADIKKKIPASPGTIYSIGSITKLFTSIAIMQLYEEGKLRLDDSLSSILPEYPVNQQFYDSGPITVRSLLTHSSGLPRESDFPYWTGPDFKFPTKEEVGQKLSEQHTLYPASTYFQYSNLGMTLLGQIIEKISGRPYEIYIQENILNPLRLAHTYPGLHYEALGTQLATGYTSLNREGIREAVPFFDTEAIKPAAGYASNVNDLAQFASWQFRLLENGGKEILHAATLKDMQRVHWIDPDWKTHWGLGFAVFQQNGITLRGHWGSSPGYRSLILLDNREKLGIIVLTNTMESPWTYANYMRQILLKGEKEKNSTLPETDLDEYTGVYQAQPWNSEKKVLSWYGHLAILDLPSTNPLESMTLLKHIDGDIFRRIRRDDSLGEEFIFERDARTGKIIKMWTHSNYSVKLK
jgi:CubicO group peptidase (beta-lactamase class C family)